jgi:AraC-like DNA-binding protein
MFIFYLLLFGISVFGFIFSIALLIRKKPVAYYFFTGVYLIFNFSLFVNVTIPLGLIDHMPHLYRVLSPLQFLFGPFSYFFFRATLRPYQKFSKWDLLHFIPFFLSIIGLIPIFILSGDEKLRLIGLVKDYKKAWYLKDTFGLEYIVAFRLKFLVFFVYLFFQWKMLLGYIRHASLDLRQKNQSLQIWLFFDIILKSLICLIIFVSSWVEQYAGLATTLQMVLGSIEVIMSAFFLIASPDLLKGVEFQDVIANSIMNKAVVQGRRDHGNDEPKESYRTAEYEDVMFRIEQFLQLEQPFLDPDFSVGDLSTALKLNSRTVSAAIKSTIGIGFPEYINKKRLIYLERQLQTNPDMLTFSVDAIAKSVGFNSRSGFYKAFKKAGVNESPGKMISMIRERSNNQN